jgi:hypothetical protein
MMLNIEPFFTSHCTLAQESDDDAQSEYEEQIRTSQRVSDTANDNRGSTPFFITLFITDFIVLFSMEVQKTSAHARLAL